MKRYTINCHYDMVISVDVIADNEQQAIELAKFKAEDIDLKKAECYDQSQCVADVEALTAEELRRMENEAVMKMVKQWFASYSDPTDKDEKRTLFNVAFGKDVPYWPAGISQDTPQWERNLLHSLRDGTHPRMAVFERYVRLYGLRLITIRYGYGRTAKSLYAADCEGTDKLQKKQAVIDGVRCLCDKMEEYVTRQDDPDYKGWEPQMVIRYESTTGDTENYWNLFVYCEGPNDHDGDDYLSLRTSWQHVWNDEDGKDATDDYGSEEHETRAALLRYLFYDDAQEFDETDETVSWERITDVWVD